MKHIDTTTTALNKIKSQAKLIKSEQGIQHSLALEIAAKEAGYENFHHATTCAANTAPDQIKLLLGSLKIIFHKSEKIAEFAVEDEALLLDVTDHLDETVFEVGGGMGDMSVMDEDALDEVIRISKRLVKKEPAFLDGYAHWVGALVAYEENKEAREAVSIGMPVLDAAFQMIETIPKGYYLNYYSLANRPFFRLAHNMVLALYGVNKPIEAKELAEKMLKVWPNDNVGFRFLLEPPRYY